MIIAQSGKKQSFKAGHELVEGIAWVREVEQDESEAVMRRGSVFPVGDSGLRKAERQRPQVEQSRIQVWY